MSDPNGTFYDKTSRVLNDCVVQPVWQEPGFFRDVCHSPSPPTEGSAEQNLEPKNMHRVGTYAYSKLQLPPTEWKASGANGEGYSQNAPMVIAGSGNVTTTTTTQDFQPPQSAQSGGAYSYSPDYGTSYGGSNHSIGFGASPTQGNYQPPQSAQFDGEYSSSIGGGGNEYYLTQPTQQNLLAVQNAQFRGSYASSPGEGTSYPVTRTQSAYQAAQYAQSYSSSPGYGAGYNAPVATNPGFFPPVPPQSAAQAGGYSSSMGSALGGPRTNYGTVENPDYKGKSNKGESRKRSKGKNTKGRNTKGEATEDEDAPLLHRCQ